MIVMMMVVVVWVVMMYIKKEQKPVLVYFLIYTLKMKSQYVIAGPLPILPILFTDYLTTGYYLS